MANVYFEKKNGENLLLNENEIVESGNNYIQFSNGLQFCWGHEQLYGTISRLITYPHKFASSTPFIFLSIDTNIAPTQDVTLSYHWYHSEYSDAPSTFEGAEQFHVRANKNISQLYFSYLAIGKWK